ncbi:MAG: DUF962 domain-containing protein [Sphingobacteriales bacterium]|jgi:uncharacterized membrane protein YGL010W|nr:DUF962 domain-containing protein [Sphingobacteriales bacterium]MBP9141176.1 DUF962 domain-containing protein [Chitinophagales bacterium]MDA0198148.1 DUF962 domain-containing protein [Bacteroidota bacterium]MBK6889293.1 DUF962 domain-containing protein [Sphingobacteriales bacterium]MBK7528209.1 DUF962 domain-containing protein [Sphingobacteriales bacterium]
MRTIQNWLDAYAVSHKNSTNKLIHWICIPAIMFSLFGLLYSIPFFTAKTLLFNWATFVLIAALIFYLRLSFAMFAGFTLIGLGMIWGNHKIALSGANLPLVSIIVFVVAWIGQFIGHKIEGAKPSFFEDLQFLLIGPAWLLSFIFKKTGIRY